jgi:hypothetical protein
VIGPTLAFAVLTGALIAGDPDMEWSTDTQPGSVPLPTTPAPAPPPPAARAPLGPEAELAAAVTPLPGRTPLDKNFRAMLELDGAFSPNGMGQLGAGLEVDWYALRFLRLHAMLGAAWIPVSSPYAYNASPGTSSRGAMKILFGADAVLPLWWGELFMGLDSGLTYTDLTSPYAYPDCFNGPCGYYGDNWSFAPAARVRAGIDVTLKRPLVIGADIGYGLIAQNFGGEAHFAELHVRLGFAF